MAKKGAGRMSFNREDFYDECKEYVQAIEMLDFIEEYWKYDLPKSVLATIESKCYQTIEFYEEKYHDRVLRE